MKGYNVKLIPSLEELNKVIQDRMDDNRIFLTLGAGAISKKVREISSCF